ncbi:MAG: exo-alpha-sialidase [Paenibacillaceae bacterium]|nr:exo-alpha-sialidase [Paenibacillaceae bacterium]
MAMKMAEMVVLRRDPRVELTSLREAVVTDNGLQPFLHRSGTGTLYVQAQLPQKPFPANRIVMKGTLLATYESADDGAHWERSIPDPQGNEVNWEGGAFVLLGGQFAFLDTYVTPGTEPGSGEGLLWRSAGSFAEAKPEPITFELPGVRFTGSTDDCGDSHAAARLHRRVLRLPEGDLLTTLYCWFDGDDVPVPYMPSMKKTRVVLLRSTDDGRSWRLQSTIAQPADFDGSSEGFNEAVLGRVSQTGRLLCFMRTGRELCQATSDDNGRSWSGPRPVLADFIDIRRTADWASLFPGGSGGEPQPELSGAVVDPDLIELSSGELVLAFGVRIPEKACWRNPSYPRNGNYIAVSLDRGETWSHIAQVTSGTQTTHYMGVVELAPGRIGIVYDVGTWGGGNPRGIRFRELALTVTQ